MNEIFIYRMVMEKIFFYRPELFRNENGDNNMKDLTLEEFFEEYEKAYIFKFDEQDNSIIIKRHNIFYSEPGLKRKSLAESTQTHVSRIFPSEVLNLLSLISIFNMILIIFLRMITIIYLPE